MTSRHTRGLALRVAALLFIPAGSSAQQAAPAAAAEVTFSRDIAPILQRSCQQCHRPGGVAPMPLIS
jgi:mono/diheme cytochrome c family protein